VAYITLHTLYAVFLYNVAIMHRAAIKLQTTFSISKISYSKNSSTMYMYTYRITANR